MNCHQHCKVPKRWNQSPKHRVLGGFLTDMADTWLCELPPAGSGNLFCRHAVKIIRSVHLKIVGAKLCMASPANS